jgi:hypothetical protein
MVDGYGRGISFGLIFSLFSRGRGWWGRAFALHPDPEEVFHLD